MRPDLLILAGILAQAPAAPGAALTPGDTVIVVVEGDRSIRGRLRDVGADALAIDASGSPASLPLSSVQQIDRIGDSVLNGTAIGAAIGGASALGAMALACSNTNCSDTSSNLDPRWTLVGALAGAGMGALIDGVREARKTVYRAGDQPPTLALAGSSGNGVPWTVFGRAGWAGFSDDEGSLGDGAAFSAGVLMPIGRRVALQLAYDRHNHRRDIESGAPAELGSFAGFRGTEQLFTVKTLLFFRNSKMFRPYAGVGGGLLDSRRTSEFPTYRTAGGHIVVAGPPEIFSYRTSEFALGFAAGGLWRLSPRFSILSDLSLDLASDGLGSSRLTLGAGYHF